MQKYFIGAIIGSLFISILYFSPKVSAYVLPSPNSSSTLSGVYALVMGKLDMIQKTINRVQDTCAKR